MRILQIVQYFPPAYSYGGPVKQVYEISKRLVEKGHDVTVLTTDVFDKKKRSGLPFFEQIDGIEVYRVRNLSNYLAANFNLFYSPEIKKFLKLNLDFDIIHFHDFRSPNNYFVSQFYKGKARQFMSPYGSMSKFEKVFLKNIFDLLFGKKLIDNIDTFVAVSEVEKKYIETFTKKNNIRIIPNSIDLSEIEYDEKINIRKELNLPKEKKIILFFSRLNKMKNPEFAIEVYTSLPKKTKEKSILVIAGPEDGATEGCRKLVEKYNLKDKVFIFPKTFGKEKWNLYKESSVLVLPTNDQAFPLVQLEALAMETPVVTSEVALKDYLENDLGAVVNFDNNDVAREITRILSSNNRASKGPDLIKSHYSMESYVEELEILYAGR